MLLLLLLTLVASASSLDLSGTWLLRFGDDPSWAHLVEPEAEAVDPNEGWAPFPVPGAWPSPRGDTGWYLRTVDLSSLEPDGLGLLLSGFESVAEVYADGRRIARAGRFPPDVELAYHSRILAPLPSDSVARGEVTLAVRVHQPANLPMHGGLRLGPPRIGPLHELRREADRRELPVLLLCGIFLAVAVYHLHLWSRRPSLRSYLYFGLASLLVAVYIAGRTQAPIEWLGWEASKRLQLTAQFLSPVAIGWFLLRFFGRPVGALGWMATVLSVIGAALCAAGPIGLAVRVAPLQAIALFSAIAWMCAFLLLAVWRQEPESRLLATGAVAVCVAAIHDTLVFGAVLQNPFIIHWGYAALVGSMALSLSNRFVRVHSEVDELNRDLERRVAERTRQLAQLNEELTSRVRQQVDELLRRSRLDRYFSRQLLDRVIGQAQDLPDRAQRVRVTLLFADLAGFTALSDRREPEVVHALLDSFLARMIEVVEAAGATLDKLMGDGVMVIVGAPEPLPPDEQALRAVQLGVAMQRALAALRDQWRAEGHDDDLQLRIGVHQDLVTVGHFGSDDLVTYTAIGKGVNLASRLEGACPPGMVLISDAIAQRLPPEIELQGPQARQLKGISEPVQTWVVRVDAVDRVVLGATHPGAERRSLGPVR